ncbi:MAG: hypothetical protein AAGG02_10830 [Cyanobacteria bacterium P01_H01_bin.15]
MSSPSGAVKDRMKSLNKDLSVLRIGHRSGYKRIELRGILPSKSGSGDPSRQRVSTEYLPTLPGVAMAYTMACEIERQLEKGTFKWTDWSNSKECSDLAGDVIDRFKKDFFDRKGTNPHTLDSWRTTYERPVNLIPRNKRLTAELLKASLCKTKANTRSRQLSAVVLNSVATFADIECDFSRLKGNYTGPAPRDLPTDKIIEDYRLELIDTNRIRWIKAFELIAAYGLRPHEIFKLDCSRIAERGHPLTVLDDSKTGYHTAYPLHPRWFEEWRISDNLALPLADLSNRSNRQQGSYVTNFFKNQKQRNDWTVTATDLRDAYAVRADRLQISTATAARWMGHSLQVHTKKYLVHLGQHDEADIWELIRDRSI